MAVSLSPEPRALGTLGVYTELVRTEVAVTRETGVALIPHILASPAPAHARVKLPK